MPQIKDYTEQTSLNSTDEFVIQETAGGLTKKVLWSSMSSGLNSWEDAGETWVYDSADSPTFTALVSGDKRSKYSKGMKLRLEQDEALTSYWSFDSDLTDGVGSNDGSAIGGAASGAGGKFGNGLTLDGSTQAVSIVDDATLKPTGDFTIGAFFKTSASGVTSVIFQSYSDNTNANGIRLYIGTSDVLAFGIGTNSASDSTTIVGSSTVTDGEFHKVVVTVRNNWVQIYLDDKLEASGYSANPTYHATNYVRIGVLNIAGTDVAGTWFNGTIDDLFLINGYALDEETIRAKYEAETAQGVSDVTIQKKFLLTGIDYDGSDTTLTLYGGTDFALSNDTIANPYFSIVQQPYNFNRNPDKWSVIVQDNVDRSTSLTTSAFSNLGSLQINIPAGEWDVSFSGCIQLSLALAGDNDIIYGLSSVADAFDNLDMKLRSDYNGSSVIISSFFIKSKYDLSEKDIFYVVFYNNTAVTITTELIGSIQTTFIIAKSIWI